MIKKCQRCKIVKEDYQFNWKTKGVRRASYCRSCSREYIREHYLKNKEYYVKKAKIRNKKSRVEMRDYIAKKLLSNPCADCGEVDLLVLEFDHMDRAKKKFLISGLVRSLSSMSKLKTEIDKCEVRCANCHRRKTEIENKSWKLKYAPVA